jgi:hypothetical protein
MVTGEVCTSSSHSPAQGVQEDPFNMIAETDLEGLDISPEAIIGIKTALKSKDCPVLSHALPPQSSQAVDKERVIRQ